MSLKQRACVIPACDHPGCDFELDGDVLYHYDTAEEAAEAWGNYDGWTDLTAWFCLDHRSEPHPFVDDPTDPDVCARCSVYRDMHEE